MLAEFTVRNFRSLKDEVRLSLEAWGGDHEHPEACVTVSPEESSGKQVRLLKSAAIYGPNNSGKSNLYKAALAMRQCVLFSSTYRGKDSPLSRELDGYRLDPDLSDGPSTFEVTFYLGQAKYTYGFAADREKVHEEWLHAWPKGSGRKQTWFERSTSEYSDETWYFGSGLTGKFKTLSDSYKSDVLFLSMFTTVSNQQLKPLLQWFEDRFHFINNTVALAPDAMKLRAEEDPDFAAWAKKLIRKLDLRIDDFEVVESNAPIGNQVFFHIGELPTKQRERIERGGRLRMQIDRPLGYGYNGVGHFDLERDESHGTQKLISLLPILYDMLRNGACLWIDELENGLHTLQIKYLIELLHDDKVNPNGMQLIFTSHQALLLDPAIFRRDQIYLMACDQRGESSLASLLDFKSRKDEAWCKGYLTGRYGAVPYLSEIGVDNLALVSENGEHDG